ncbi:uncharacterized protein LOC121293802 isoform X1 [Carcharodon carcharias]|uniref:uncharacterized protein LOC121293802 isoform X1 n=2 Tax=Carcharodon carcharias TaxID=13397 RepID=UPI001B7F13E6|nr:uncharacterized protein LOC121293802 isoform X1 [Carcharodon carcharias]
MMASSENGKDLVFEGYLKKRKDKMRFAWAKYWFRLQNTTLFFYTEKDCESCHLRGQYYIYMVQSVREIKATNHEYPFEIVMKNGKRKLLAAERSDLRAVWMEFLWKAMQLPGPGKKNSACTWHDIPCLIERAASLCQDTTKREHSSLFSSSDIQSQDFTSDTVHLHKSSVASRETSFKYLNILDITCDHLPDKQETKADVDLSPWPEVAGKVNCQSGVYDVPKSFEKLKIDSNVQSYSDEPFTSSSNTGLLDEIISDCRISTYHWLDSTETQNASIPT